MHSVLDEGKEKCLYSCDGRSDGKPPGDLGWEIRKEYCLASSHWRMSLETVCTPVLEDRKENPIASFPRMKGR